MSSSAHPRDSEWVSCPTCGVGWFTRALCEACAFRAGGADPSCGTCHGTGEAGLTKAHRCPEPYPYDVARSMLAMCEGGMLVTQTQKARIKLGLEMGPNG